MECICLAVRVDVLQDQDEGCWTKNKGGTPISFPQEAPGPGGSLELSQLNTA